MHEGLELCDASRLCHNGFFDNRTFPVDIYSIIELLLINKDETGDHETRQQKIAQGNPEKKKVEPDEACLAVRMQPRGHLFCVGTAVTIPRGLSETHPIL